MTCLSDREQSVTMMMSDAMDRDHILGPVLHASEDRLLALRSSIGGRREAQNLHHHGSHPTLGTLWSRTPLAMTIAASPEWCR